MAGEFVEDLKINLMNMDNKDLESKCRFLPADKSSFENERLLGNCLDSETARSIINDPQIALKLNEEYNQLQRDREDLRKIILKNQGADDTIHIPVNLPRIIWNAKEQFKIRQSGKTDLHPSYVLQRLQNLFEELSPIPGIKVRNDPLIL